MTSTAKVNRLVAAAGLFSAIPAPPVLEINRDVARRAMTAMPLLGGLLGIGASLLPALAWWLDAPLLAGALWCVGIQLLTGAMHLDGLADVTDGLAALGSRKEGRDRQRALDIMHQPDIGAMGVAAIIMVLLVEAAALASGDLRYLVLAVLAPLVGRIGAVIGSCQGIPAARPGGFGALFAEIMTPASAIWWTIGAMVLGAGGGWLAGGLWGAIGVAAAALLAVLFSWALLRHIVRVLGGVTGDCFGAVIETTTAVFLALGALAL